MSQKQNTVPIPTVHSNGTAGTALYAGYTTAIHSVQDACDAVNNAILNGRDYYPEGPEAFDGARDHRNSMLEKLRSVFEDLQTIAAGIDDQSNNNS